MDEQELLPIEDEETSLDEDQENTPDTSDEDIPTEESNWYDGYIILDENGETVINPDLELGHLEKEEQIIHHEGSPEIGHYYVNYIVLNNGESFFLEEKDPRIEITNSRTGAFKYLPSEEDPSIQVKNASIKYVIDQYKINPWEEKQIILRYILYTEEELANRDFLAKGPERLETLETDTTDLLTVVADLAGSDIEERFAETQETVDELLLVIADLLGGNEEQ